MSVRDTNSDWERISHEDPYWGVLSVDTFRGLSLTDEKARQFFASGAQFVAELLGCINRFVSDVPLSGRALDFGCGVGRLAIPLSKHFREAVGVDIAEGMLTLARDNAKKAQANNLTFLKGDDMLSRIQGEFDLVNTYIVLQHIPPDRGMMLIRRLIELTCIGGVCAIQLTYARERKHLEHEAPRARYYRREGVAMIDIGRNDSDHPTGTISMYDYDLNDVFTLVSEHAGHPVLSLPTNDDGHLGVHFIFKRAS